MFTMRWIGASLFRSAEIGRGRRREKGKERKEKGDPRGVYLPPFSSIWMSFLMPSYISLTAWYSERPRRRLFEMS